MANRSDNEREKMMESPNTKIQWSNTENGHDLNDRNKNKIFGLKRLATTFELKTLTHLAKRPAVEIDFADLSYSVRQPSKRNLESKKIILQSVSGRFRSGELTAIMGSSGAGKSTLMNILAGYVCTGVSGSIRTNGNPIEFKKFNKLSAYIMQDDLLQPLLTVHELMTISAQLKLGNELTDDQKYSVIDEILEMLGLSACRDTRTEKLSGGQRKRLSVALELVNNPPVLFLDEPTTGLDTVSIKQLISLLKLLAQQGRTVICTVHQPTSSIFSMFDHVYVLGTGQCVYQGSHNNLVPFLSSIGLQCPLHYNPADYIIETIHGENKSNIRVLSAEISNGKISLSNEKDPNREKQFKFCKQSTLASIPKLHGSADDKYEMQFATSYTTQLRILLSRMFLQKSRNLTTIWISLLHHVLCGIFVGLIFKSVGNDGTRPFDNFKFIVSVIVFFMYTHLMLPVLIFPPSISLLQREYFNRWYGLKSYYSALILSSLPDHILLGPIFIVITYAFTNQPLDLERFLLFSFFGILTGIVSEGMGQVVGSICSITNGSIVAPASIVPFLALAFYGMGFGKSVEPFMEFLMSLSYLRFGVVGICLGLFVDREEFDCTDEMNYCHYQEPRLLLRDLGVEGRHMYNQIFGLLITLAFFRVSSFYILRYRLNLEFSNQVFNLITKVLKRFKIKY